MTDYDLAVIGSGPAGQKGAIAATKLGKRVAMIDRKERVGGVSIHTGTIPSKTLREAILYLSGFRERSFYGRDYSVKDEISVSDLAFRVQAVMAREVEVMRAQLKRNRVELVPGTAKFLDSHTLEIQGVAGTTRLSAEHVLIACGTRPAHSSTVPIDGRRVIDSDQLMNLDRFPRELIVVGAGIIGLEYASMITALGIKVTIIEQRPTILDFVDREIIEALDYFMRQRGAVFRLGEKLLSVEIDEKNRVVANLDSGKRVHGDALLYTVGRQTNADLLDLPAAGLTADDRGKMSVNEFFQTSVPHIYAAGDVIGFPASPRPRWAGPPRLLPHVRSVLPQQEGNDSLRGLHDPEISVVGKTEEELTPRRSLRDRHLAVRGAREGADAGHRGRHAEDPLRSEDAEAAGRARHRRKRGRDRPHRPGRARLRGTIEYFRDTVFNTRRSPRVPGRGPRRSQRL